MEPYGRKETTASQNTWKSGLNGEPVGWSSGATSIPVVIQGTELSWEERDMLLPQIYGSTFWKMLRIGSSIGG